MNGATARSDSALRKDQRVTRRTVSVTRGTPQGKLVCDASDGVCVTLARLACDASDGVCVTSARLACDASDGVGAKPPSNTRGQRWVSVTVASTHTMTSGSTPLAYFHNGVLK